MGTMWFSFACSLVDEILAERIMKYWWKKLGYAWLLKDDRVFFSLSRIFVVGKVCMRKNYDQ